MSEITIYHNPRCSKSRKALEILNTKFSDITVKEYLKEGISCEEVIGLSRLLDAPVSSFVRTKEADYNKNLDWDNESIAALELSKHPILLERPIVVFQNKAVVARPPEKIKTLFGDN